MTFFIGRCSRVIQESRSDLSGFDGFCLAEILIKVRDCSCQLDSLDTNPRVRGRLDEGLAQP